MPFEKYEPWCEFIHGLPFDNKWIERKWPSQRLLRAPQWCSVDLRDGNQALVNPMDVNKKIRYFRTLISMGFKQIEIGFPSASKLDFDFTRLLIEGDEIPDGVWVMVLVQARDHLIKQTIEAVKGAKRVIIHLYNSTSELQRRVVFNLTREEIRDMAVNGTKLIRSLSDEFLIPLGCQVRLEYSPESFTGTEIQFALEVCHSVMDAWRVSDSNGPIIFNLPETVQNAGPHFYADQIEWMHCHLKERQNVILSVHPHNDRGTGVASAELAMHAGADRVEGCLFGNGERTGNVCLITLAVNFMHHGIDPELDLSNIPHIVEVFEECTGMKVPDRHPWVGSLVYTAFSGSHQDAIKKGLEAMKKKKKSQHHVIWEVPYLPIDPKDLGCSYDAIVRLNSQSGKGGVAYIMESVFGIVMPRGLQIEFSRSVQKWCDETAKEVDPQKVYELFCEVYLDNKTPLHLTTYRIVPSNRSQKQSQCDWQNHQVPPSQNVRNEMHDVESSTTTDDMSTMGCSDEAAMNESPTSGWLVVDRPILTDECPQHGDQKIRIEAELEVDSSNKIVLMGQGNGPIDAFLTAFNHSSIVCTPALEGLQNFQINNFYEMAIGKGSSAEAICFIELQADLMKSPSKKLPCWGVARNTNSMTASLHAICSSLNRISRLHSPYLFTV